MSRIVVESWSPEYGTPLDPDEALAPAEGSVDDGVETTDWTPRDGVDDGVEQVAFVDGVRRVDARLTVDDAVFDLNAHGRFGRAVEFHVRTLSPLRLGGIPNALHRGM